jgi:hypothetical protein
MVVVGEEHGAELIYLENIKLWKTWFTEKNVII